MKRMSWYPLALFVAFSITLSGCNEGEDFGEAEIGGPIITGPELDTDLPGETEDAVEIELVVGKEDGGKFHSANVAHLKYKCTGDVGSIPATGAKKHLARCAPTARSVEFFIGESTSTVSERISLGTAYLPMCSGRSDGSGGTTGCVGGTGFFQVTLADLVPYAAPEPGDPASLSAPARRLASDAEVRNRAALLAALDVSSDKLVLEVAYAASNLAANARTLVTDPASMNFTKTPYADFQADWQPWLNQLAPIPAMPIASTVDQMSQAAMSRTRMGLYSLERSSTLYSLDPNENTLNLEITVPFIVMPDGSVAGVGALFTTVGAGVNIKAATDLLAIEAGAQLDESLRIMGAGGAEHWQVDGVLGADPVDSPSVKSDLQFRGRIIGSSGYDNKAPQGEPSPDYRLDYPDVGLYVLKPDDQARFAGFASTDNNALVDKPYRIGRTGSVSAVLHTSVINKLKGFYQVTIYKACVGNEVSPGDPECVTIPVPGSGIEVGPGLNYPDAFYAECSSGVSGCEDERLVTLEKPRGGNTIYDYAYAEGSFRLQILEDGSIVTDRRGTCLPLDAGPDLERNGLKEYRVGYVSRTLPSDDGTTDSANVLIFMATSASAALAAANNNVSDPLLGEFMPHFGTQIQGRINLSTATPKKPMYRLGDDNFTDGIRAYWQDFYQPGKYASDKTEFKGDIGHQLQALAGGAAAGVAVDEISCMPVP